MMTRSIAGWLLVASLAPAAPMRSGHATAEWLAESASAKPGGRLRTAIRLVIDPHWHTYWINPGEAGMATSVVWDLPAGWKPPTFAHPVPKRFLTGELVGFGHEGTVLFPVELAIPAGFSGTVELRGSISWLSCNDDACVPGDAAISLALTAGESSPTPAADAIGLAFASLPKPVATSVSLQLKPVEDGCSLTIEGDPGLDPSRSATFVETPDVVDPKAEIKWAREKAGWTTGVPKSGFATAQLGLISLILVPPSPAGAVRLVWRNPGTQ